LRDLLGGSRDLRRGISAAVPLSCRALAQSDVVKKKQEVMVVIKAKSPSIGQMLGAL